MCLRVSQELLLEQKAVGAAHNLGSEQSGKAVCAKALGLAVNLVCLRNRQGKRNGPGRFRGVVDKVSLEPG